MDNTLFKLSGARKIVVYLKNRLWKSFYYLFSYDNADIFLRPFSTRPVLTT